MSDSVWEFHLIVLGEFYYVTILCRWYKSYIVKLLSLLLLKCC